MYMYMYAGSEIAYGEGDAIRHVKCHLLFKPESKRENRCPVCLRYRENYLRRALNRMKEGKENSDPCKADSHVNYRYLNTQQKDERLRRLHTELKSSQNIVKKLEKKIKSMMDSESITLDESTSADMQELMKGHSFSDKDNSFKALFWKEQMKAISMKNPKSMRWHPQLIKWCLYLHYKSSGAYETLRQSGVLRLPSGRTLRDYRHFAPAVMGFSADYDKQLLDLSKKTPGNSKHIAILVDEMYVKEGLVFNKHTGALTGFVDLGDATNHLDNYDEPKRKVAKTVVVLMVRGLVSDLIFPYAMFAAASLTGPDLFPLVWKAIGRLTLLGFRPLVITCDGAKNNRKMFAMHGDKNTYKTVNIFSRDRHPIFFISDPPHLLKCIRNCLYNKTRNLWVSVSFYVDTTIPLYIQMYMYASLN